MPPPWAGFQLGVETASLPPFPDPSFIALRPQQGMRVGPPRGSLLSPRLDREGCSGADSGHREQAGVPRAGGGQGRGRGRVCPAGFWQQTPFGVEGSIKGGWVFGGWLLLAAGQVSMATVRQVPHFLDEATEAQRRAWGTCLGLHSRRGTEGGPVGGQSVCGL